VEDETRAHLAARYGHAARDVLRLAAAAPRLAQRITRELPDIGAEAAFAAGHEQARSLGDVMLRRTRLGILDARRMSDPAAEEVLLVARAMAGELGWDDARVGRELDAWTEEARLEGIVARGARPAASDRLEEASMKAGAAPEEAA
jgi:glycerol-3-phosphate dehydrogenase